MSRRIEKKLPRKKVGISRYHDLGDVKDNIETYTLSVQFAILGNSQCREAGCV